MGRGASENREARLGREGASGLGEQAKLPCRVSVIILRVTTPRRELRTLGGGDCAPVVRVPGWAPGFIGGEVSFGRSHTWKTEQAKHQQLHRRLWGEQALVLWGMQESGALHWEPARRPEGRCPAAAHSV